MSFGVTQRGMGFQPMSHRQDADATMKIVLAYSGGLDTSVAVKWMHDEWLSLIHI